MAFDKTGLQPIGGQAKAGNAPQMWSYTSTDAKTAIDAEGYFNDVSDLLKVGDIICPRINWWYENLLVTPSSQQRKWCC